MKNSYKLDSSFKIEKKYSIGKSRCQYFDEKISTIKKLYSYVTNKNRVGSHNRGSKNAPEKESKGTKMKYEIVGIEHAVGDFTPTTGKNANTVQHYDVYLEYRYVLSPPWVRVCLDLAVRPTGKVKYLLCCVSVVKVLVQNKSASLVYSNHYQSVNSKC